MFDVIREIIARDEKRVARSVQREQVRFINESVSRSYAQKRELSPVDNTTSGSISISNIL